MNEETIKAWITTYALTTGIKVVDAKMCGGVTDSRMVRYGNQYAYGKDWHRTPEAAIARAEEMRKAKIASLRKSIEKMESLRFDVGG